MTTAASWLKGHEEAARRLLTALKQAEKWVATHPEAAQAYLHETPEKSAVPGSGSGNEHRFVVSLPAALVTSLSEEVRWLKNRKLVDGREPADVLDLIYPTTLKGVEPGAVTVTR